MVENGIVKMRTSISNQFFVALGSIVESIKIKILARPNMLVVWEGKVVGDITGKGWVFRQIVTKSRVSSAMLGSERNCQRKGVVVVEARHSIHYVGKPGCVLRQVSPWR